MYSDREHIYDIKGNKDCLLVIEMQCYYRDALGKTKMQVFGWTLIELFDLSLDLMRGKWKVPFYSTKINPNMLITQIKQLNAVSNTMLYLRISFPQDMQFGFQDPKNPFVQSVPKIFYFLL